MDKVQLAKSYTLQHPQWSIREKNIAEMAFLAGHETNAGKIPLDKFEHDPHTLSDHSPVDRVLQEGKDTHHVDTLQEAMKGDNPEIINDGVVRGEGQFNKKGSNHPVKLQETPKPFDGNKNVEDHQKDRTNIDPALEHDEKTQQKENDLVQSGNPPVLQLDANGKSELNNIAGDQKDAPDKGQHQNT